MAGAGRLGVIVAVQVDVAMAMLAAFLGGGFVGIVVGAWWREEARTGTGGAG